VRKRRLSHVRGPAHNEPVAFDLAIYLQHVLSMPSPALWLHRVHHADLEVDVTTGARFHPVEILLSMGLKMGVVAALGAPAIAVLAFEVLLNATSMFSHSNVHIPRRFDRVLRWIVVTPDMHRVHHSVVAGEANSNSASICRGGTPARHLSRPAGCWPRRHDAWHQ
jgi:sterol desaturase/sphingolipid hydroxylase (fatty acid hydroxylase superfamily)